MTKWKLKSKRKTTGAKIKSHCKKKRQIRLRDYMPSHIGERKNKILKIRNGKKKVITLSDNTANIIVNGKAQKTKIISVLENRANPQLVRRNIMTKGAIVETELGKARITSRPGQSGAINAVLMEKK